ncbi:uncharacterized protein LOC143203149 [Rhynchophorus ferrugineus]|uniref:uncharacterized protein LOC143203149 n=1 Tax=Rhynchophorus ferrugineus TaxID=354439 RepID=UPI003FCCF538
MEGKNLINKPEHKFFGLLFDHKLNWHINYLKNKCLADLGLLNTLSNINWGAHGTSLSNIYQELIRSKLDYGSQCYITAPPSYVKKLDPIQNAAIRIILGAFRTSPVESLQCEADISSLESRRELLLLNYASSLKFRPELDQFNTFFLPKTNWTNIRKRHLSPSLIFQRICKRLMIVIPDAKCRITNIPPWHFSRIHIDLSMKVLNKETNSSSTIKSFFRQIIEENYSNHFIIYTDGSKRENFVGAAYTSSLLQRKYFHRGTAGYIYGPICLGRITD